MGGSGSAEIWRDGKAGPIDTRVGHDERSPSVRERLRRGQGRPPAIWTASPGAADTNDPDICQAASLRRSSPYGVAGRCTWPRAANRRGERMVTQRSRGRRGGCGVGRCEVMQPPRAAGFRPWAAIAIATSIRLPLTAASKTIPDLCRLCRRPLALCRQPRKGVPLRFAR